MQVESSGDETLQSQLLAAKEAIEHKEKLIQQLCDENTHLTEQISQTASASSMTNDPTMSLQTVESLQQTPVLGSVQTMPQLEDMHSRIRQLEENVAERECQIDQLCAENSTLIERLATSEPTVSVPAASESLETRVHELECIIQEKDKLMEKIHKENVKLANIDRPEKLDSDTTYQIQVLQGKLDEKEKSFSILKLPLVKRKLCSSECVEKILNLLRG